MNKNQNTYFSNSSMCVKSQSQSSQVEYFRTLPFRELVERVEEQIEMYTIGERDEEEARSLAMMIAEVYKLPPAAMVKIAGNNLPAEMVSEVFLQITAEHIEHVLTNYRQAKYHIHHTKTYLRTALYNAVFEIELRVDNMVRADIPDLF